VTTSIPATSFTGPVPARRLERAASALTARDFAVEILDDAAAARARVKELIPEGASVFTGASETLRLSGIEEDINKSGRYDSLKSRPLMDRATQRNEIWAALSTPTSSWAASLRSPKPVPLLPPRPAEASYPATPVPLPA
jgi:hypothetical protein